MSEKISEPRRQRSGVSGRLVRLLRFAACAALILASVMLAAWREMKPLELAAAPTDPKSPPAKDNFRESVRPIFNQFCVTCHNDKKKSAGMSLEQITSTDSARKTPDLWEKVKELVENKQMPPKGKPQPSDAERKAIVAWIDTVAIKVDCGLTRDPGRPTIRRLNRNEFNNTIRDLAGVDFKPADNFPADDVGYGFDNIGDVLSMPPILLEKYLTAAESIVEKAIVVPKPIEVIKNVRRPQNVASTLGESSKEANRIYLHSNGAAYFQHEFPFTGEYIIRARAYGDQAGTELPKMEIRLDRKLLVTHEVDALKAKPKYYDTRLVVSAGRHDLRFEYINDWVDKNDKTKDRNLSIEVMEIEGPFKAVPPPLPASHKMILVASPATLGERESSAQKVIEAFATRAYRRPLKPDELARLMKLFKFADSPTQPFEQSIKHPLKAVLVSPHFLFRIERDVEPNNPQAIHLVNQHELATRLSYFLWASMPDEELTKLANDGKLRDAGVLEAQVRRMLKDPKASALVESFTGQWLMLRTLATQTPDKATFKNFDEPLRKAMVRETELYFDYVMREDRSILEFLDSDYTFVNDRLAKHYGLPGYYPSEFKKVKLTDKNRGGILTQASILTVTSNPTRTSPVKRGKWILENILGTPPPPPPPDVPVLENDSKAVLTGSLRQRMEKHRENPSCAVCHSKLDPLGFGLENFDAVGAFRTMDGTFKIDPAGVLPDGAIFSGPEEMRKVLVAKADLFRRNLSEKMLTYALGRGLEYYDRCAVDDIVTGLKNGDDHFAAMMIAVVKSDPFQKRRGSAAKKE
jgi:mono/diheme cytochrome c family protein